MRIQVTDYFDCWLIIVQGLLALEYCYEEVYREAD